MYGKQIKQKLALNVSRVSIKTISNLIDSLVFSDSLNFITRFLRLNNHIAILEKNGSQYFVIISTDILFYGSNYYDLQDLTKVEVAIDFANRLVDYATEGKYFLFKKQITPEDLYEKLKNYNNFIGVCHYTDFSNLLSIIDKKFIFSRKNASKFIRIDSADSSIIDITKEKILHHVRFFYAPLTPTHFKNSGIKPEESEYHMPLPVLIIMKKEIFMIADAVYTNGGAASHFSKLTSNLNEAYNYNWEEIFKRAPIIKNELNHNYRKFLTNFRNAELMIPNEVSIDLVSKLVFRSKSDYKNFKTLIPNCNIDMDVVPEYFSNHYENQYLYDHSINDLDKVLLIHLQLWGKSDFFNYFLIIYTDSENIRINVKKDNHKEIAFDFMKISCNENSSDIVYDIEINKLILKNDIIKLEFFINTYRSLIWRKT